MLQYCAYCRRNTKKRSVILWTNWANIRWPRPISVEVGETKFDWTINLAEKDTTSDWSANTRFSQSEFRKNSALYKFRFWTPFWECLAFFRQNNNFVKNSTLVCGETVWKEILTKRNYTIINVIVCFHNFRT